MQDTGSSRVRNNLKSQGSLPFFDKIRVDHILKLFGARDGAEVTVHVCVLDRELVLELECVLELLGFRYLVKDWRERLSSIPVI